ncbi:MAG: Hsp20/alpha crystallin family protein [Thermodesulfobacteriota bacterium]
MFDHMLPVFKKKNEPQERAPHTMWDVFEDMLEHPLLTKERPGCDFIPAMDVQEKNGKLVVKAELPGLEAKDVDVSIENNQLIIKGEKKDEKTEDKEGRSYSECSYGAFYRTIPIASEVDADKIKAKFKNGVLTVKVPKKAKAEGRKIAIEN